MKTAIVIGHTKGRKGAYSKYLKIHEYDLNKQIAEQLRDVADIYEYDTYNLGYTSMVKRNAKKLNKKDYDLVLELHFNAAESRQANGCEALYYFKNKRASKLAEDFCYLVNDMLGTKIRGAKALYSKKQRGYAAVYYPKATTLILEPFFGTNKDDCCFFIPELYVRLIRIFIEKIKKTTYLRKSEKT